MVRERPWFFTVVLIGGMVLSIRRVPSGVTSVMTRSTSSTTPIGPPNMALLVSSVSTTELGSSMIAPR